MVQPDVTEDKVTTSIKELIALSGGNISTFESELIMQQIQTSLKLLSEGHNIGQLKLITRALKELRYAYRIFNAYPGSYRISIFGSARTPEDHPDYIAAQHFSKAVAKSGWMCITGAANGIMKAGLAGLTPESSFGLSIRLPFEVPTNSFIEGDPKLIHFRYFFTRKLMFMSHSDAIAVFPGGFGTMDELFEILTLMQTGKTNIIPVVLMEGPEGHYWSHWERYLRDNLLKSGWISPEDRHLFFIAPSIEAGVEHIQKFYKRYHSSRYVKDDFVIRIKSSLTDEQLKILEEKFGSLIKSGSMRIGEAFPEESNFKDLPRIIFKHTRRDFGLVRALIDQINEF